MASRRLLRITTVPISLHILLNGQLQFMKQNGFEVLTVSASGKEIEYLKREGIDHKVIPFTRRITPVRDFICLLKLIWLIRKFRPHIIHTHTPKAGMLGMVAGWWCHIPVRLHTVAGLPLMESKGLKRWLLVRAEKITVACATGIYPNSARLTEYIRNKLHFNSGKIKMIGKGSSNGIDTIYFSRTKELIEQASILRVKHNIGRDTIVFSFVGRLVRDKGIGELLIAFKDLISPSVSVQDTRGVRLLLIGPFEQGRDPIEKSDYEFLKSNRNIILTDFQEDIRPWLLASDIFVFPSYREGFPNGVLQAACLELPCIVTNINGCNEIIQHEDTGLIVPPKNPDLLKQAMLRLISNTDERKQFGKNAREFVISNFEQKEVWQLLLKEYDELLHIKKSHAQLIG